MLEREKKRKEKRNSFGTKVNNNKDNNNSALFIAIGTNIYAHGCARRIW